MDQLDPTRTLSRREVLKLGTAAAAISVAGAPVGVEAQAPKRGGVFKVRHHVQPVHFDPQQTLSLIHI